MKTRVQIRILIVFVLVLSGIIGYLLWSKTPAPTPTENIIEFRPILELPQPSEPVRAPEFRKPPIKQYKPGHMQQMGLLIGADGDTLPLYGKEVRGRRDRYHYYTTTNGDNLYSIPVSHDGRDCMEDIGCKELYGNETVTVLGKNTTYTVNLYRTDNFF